MNFKAKTLFLAGLVLLVAACQSSGDIPPPVVLREEQANIEYDTQCGAPVLVSAYIVETGESVKISMPAFGRFVIEDKSLSEGAVEEAWVHNYTGAGVYFDDERTFVLQDRGDCVDFYSSRIYVFDQRGHLIVSEDVWSAHWEDGFYFDGDKLSFWSEWFCSEHNEDAQTTSYIMQLSSEFSEFMRVPMTREENCSPDAVEELRNRWIAFDWFSPDKTLIRDLPLK